MLTRTRKAFTLLELIVVIVILGILAAIAIPTFQQVIDKSKVQSAKRAAESLDREAMALGAFEQQAAAAHVDAAADDLGPSVKVYATGTAGQFLVEKEGKTVVLTTSAVQGTTGTVTTPSTLPAAVGGDLNAA